ncbi:hypothetical protein SpAn4DRAFT_4563 [Sporomusa ovata]|uniref:Uncharacterized protein n=1 Tax=Sporomusa ovata TaxID=2378 RepID=A0A0U1L7E6_9FIRM|nr:hypothetical protein [Sporomusa ovata]CQR75199.1 hypothetical protein SpAn4DRAFT_4563 [Sporomusa ovata]
MWPHIVSLAGGDSKLARGAHRARRPNPRRRVPCKWACRQQGSRGLRGREITAPTPWFAVIS